jgi:hypothetical protein
MYLDCVRRAVASPGKAIEIPKDFRSESNAAMTVHCLREGYLRVEPREGDEAITVRGKRYIRTTAPVDAEARRTGDVWRVTLRARD